jgi:PAS domain S-box-containing protein
MTNEAENIITQIQKDNAYYKSIIENNSFYIIKTDLEGKYTYLNPFFCKIFGVNAEEWIGKDSLGLIIPEDHQLCIATVEKCFAELNTTHWVILRKPSYKGILSTQWEFKLLADEKGNLNEIMCIGHDITPQVLKQEELQSLVDITAEQNKRLVNFTYIVSHNIRSHVANIIGVINVNEMDDEEDTKQAWEMIKYSTSSLDQTIQYLNKIIGIQTNTNLEVSFLNIYDEIKRVINSIQILVDNADTEILYQFEKDEMLNTNHTYFESIILNLFTNSIKYKSPERPLKINIDVKQEGKYKILTFKDNGLGIDLEKYGDQLFGMYKTFHGNTDAKGLGLFIIKTQIEAMKGKIEVESEVGASTTFKIYFDTSKDS